MNGIRLIIEDIAFSYGKKEVFRDASLCLESGSIIGIIGSNGSGKTTLMKLIGGLLFPQKGRICFQKTEGADVTTPACAQLLENPAFWQGMTGDDNLRYFLRDKYDKQAVLSEFKGWGLYEMRDVLVEKYSMGMRQKLGIILTILSEQPVLLLDEPSNSLDMESTDLLYSRLKELRDEGRLVLLVSHIADEIRKNCSEIYEISEHKINKVLQVEETENYYELYFADENCTLKAKKILEAQKIPVRLAEKQLTVHADKLERILYLTGETGIVRIGLFRGSERRGEA
ncbi:MAG: ATP-binding cassette domain-containing protein [Lachnospiraceae bacterium]|nr:ATP-binding cassette domain-containing protein [Lachnospiraceae bacterium]